MSSAVITRMASPWLALLVIFIAGSLSASEQKAESVRALSPIVAGFESTPGADRSGVIRSRSVQLDLRAFDEAARRAAERPRLELQLFEDTKVLLEVRNVAYQSDRSYTLSAVLPRGIAGGYATIAVNNSAVFAYVSIPLVGQFRIQSHGALYRVSQLDDRETRKCAVGPEHLVGAGSSGVPKEQPPMPIGGGPTIVRLLVVYTEEVLENEDAFDNDLAALEAAIQASVTTANTVLENSHVNVYIKLVDMQMVDHDETGDLGADLAALTNFPDEPSDIRLTNQALFTANEWRALVCADFMSMIVYYEPGDGGGAAGVGWLMADPSPNFAERALSVLRYTALGGTTLIHEIGHNMGCHHDHARVQAANEGSGAYPFSHGHRWQVFDSVAATTDEEYYATVMTYPPYTVGIPHFSNPRIEVPTGYPTGIFAGQTGEADNALTITLNTPYFSMFSQIIGGQSCAPTNTYWVPDDFPTIQAAIDAAEDRDQIWVAPGVYLENIDFKGKAIHVRSLSPNDPAVISTTIIDGQQLGSVVTFRTGENPDSVLNGFTIRNGSAATGGGIFISSSRPSIANCHIIDNEATFLGGGLYVLNGEAILNRCMFANNTAVAQGAGIFAQSSHLSIFNSQFNSNASGNRGGAIHTTAGTMNIGSGNVFSSNAAAVVGGAISTQATNVTMTDSLVEDNASVRGGGIYLIGGLSTFTDVEIRTNDALVSGGGVYLDNALAIFRECEIMTNTSSNHGGGIFASGGACLIDDSVIAFNSAGVLNGARGGGIYMRETNMFIEDSKILQNVSGMFGGGIFIWVDEEEDEEDWITPTISGTEICQNVPNNITGPWENAGSNLICALDIDINVPDDYSTIQDAIDAANHGDVIVVAPGTYVERIDFHGKAVHLRSFDPTDPAFVQATIIDGNVPGEGPGGTVRCVSGETPGTRINGFTITGGSTVQHGGGIRVQNSSPTIENCIITQNTASIGGGVAVFNSSSIIRNCMFFNNLATSSGGGLYVENSSALTLQNCAFEGNHANSLGGGMANLNSNQTMSGLMFEGNTAGQWGGGMFNSTNSRPTVLSSDFTNNTAVLGGGMYNSSNSPAEIGQSLFCENSPANIQGPFVNLGGNTIVAVCPPLNNTPENPMPIGNPIETIIGTFAGATRNGSSSCDPTGVDVFFSYNVLDGPATLSLDTCGSSGDTAIAIFDSLGVELGCNATCLSGPCGAPHACATLHGLPAGTYLIRISRMASMAAGSSDQFILHLHESKTTIDLNGDGVVNVSDLLILFGSWGPCSGCAADFNGDGVVNVSDLLMLLANWG